MIQAEPDAGNSEMVVDSSPCAKALRRVDCFSVPVASILDEMFRENRKPHSQFMCPGCKVIEARRAEFLEGRCNAKHQLGCTAGGAARLQDLQVLG